MNMLIILLAAVAPLGATAGPATEVAGRSGACIPRCRSGEGDINSLEILNRTVRGRVHRNTPFSLPCFSNYEGQPVEPDAEACAAVQENYASPEFRAEHPGAYMNNQDAMCSSDPENQCELDNTDPTNPLAFTNTTCRQGNVPSYYLQVTSPCDVKAAFSFARRTGTALAIKNSGHDYISHSSQKGALALWTRKLQRMQYHKTFVPQGCPSSDSSGGGKHPQAMTTGAGVSCGQAYDFAEANHITVLCGYAETVGISGGWVQGGGHSVLSPVYGLGIDRVLEFKIVTPDGQYRVANRCQNEDLFWALRGGGGGTFGVVMESTHAVEPLVPLISADIRFTSNTISLLGFMEVLLQEAVPWADLGWGGHITGSSLIYVNPKLTMEEAKESMKSAADYAIANGGTAVFKQFDSFHGFYTEYVRSNAVTVGSTHFAGSRLVPRAVLDSASGRGDILGFIKSLIAGGGSPYVPVSMPTIYNRSGKNTTSATPAWYTSLWELGAGAAWAWNSSLDARQKAIDDLNVNTALIEAVTPGGGAYMNEANPFTSDWQQAWWGQENYASLLAIKERYDPERLLKCWRCVGWEDSDVAGSCFGGLSE